MAEIGTVLLAAGLGSRFGAAPKLLARLDGKPLVRHAAEAALGARPRPVVAVLGTGCQPYEFGPELVDNRQSAGFCSDFSVYADTGLAKRREAIKPRSVRALQRALAPPPRLELSTVANTVS